MEEYERLFDLVTFDDLFKLDNDENLALWEKLTSGSDRIKNLGLRDTTSYNDLFFETLSIRMDLTNIFIGRTC